jgi:hypothetical protein
MGVLSDERFEERATTFDLCLPKTNDPPNPAKGEILPHGLLTLQEIRLGLEIVVINPG